MVKEKCRKYRVLEVEQPNWKRIDINSEIRNIPWEIQETMFRESTKLKPFRLKKRKNKTAFTEVYKNFDGRIITKEKIVCDDKEFEITVQWDCGSTYSSISNEIVKEMELKPIGKEKVESVMGSNIYNTYNIGFLLRDTDIYIPLYASDSPHIHSTGIDMLVGMDVISKGDFAISNNKDTIYFSFRFPSKGIDFTK